MDKKGLCKITKFVVFVLLMIPVACIIILLAGLGSLLEWLVSRNDPQAFAIK